MRPVPFRVDAATWLWRAGLVVPLAALAGFVLFIFYANGAYLGLSEFAHYLKHWRTWRCFGLSIVTASISATISMAVAIPVGYALARGRVPGGRLAELVLDLPVMVPPAAVGMFLLGVFGIPPGQWVETVLGLKVAHALPGVVVAQVAVTLAFGSRVVCSAFSAVDPRLEQVSRTLGAGPGATFSRVSMPLAGHGLVAGLLIVWARALAEYEALMLFVGAVQGRTDVTPLAVYLDVAVGNLEWGITDSALCIAVAALSVWAAQRLRGRARYG